MHTNKVSGVVVLYNPSEDVIENINSYIDSLDVLYAIDNSVNINEIVVKALNENSKVNYIFNGDNLGIAKALNIGVEKAICGGCEWILTMDQDSKATPNYIDSMLETYKSYMSKDKVAIIAPVYYNNSRGYSGKLNSYENKMFTEVKMTITSGNLVKVKIFSTVGFYDDDLFIDNVDFDFCIRLRKQGYRIIRSNYSSLIHEYGNVTRHKLLWRYFYTTNHSAFRRYFMARNSVILFKKYFCIEPIWVTKNLYNLCISIFKILLIEEKKTPKIKNSFKGLWDGLRGYKGKYIE
ncbi:glycosyltransferase family 2 protein [Acetivibrio cellulolyticus]|uniref:glycosyltransferase family 2 protein n=1 Tax=Acetivibrio cellulolyticus TaxID=35830 RepID=UPI0001E2F112|nr:glycosyltransferase family 2 protein [Acetivibrio cellulolyticus]